MESSKLWKKFIKSLSEHLTTKHVENLKFFADVPEGSGEKVTTGIQFLRALEEMGFIAPDQISYLYDCIDYIKRNNLKSLLNEYEESRMKILEKEKTFKPRPRSAIDFDFDPNAMNTMHYPLTRNLSANNISSHRQSDNFYQNLPRVTVGQSEDETDNSDDIYKMTSKPRGQCVIINNMFAETVTLPSGEELTNRTGSDKDKVTLQSIFTWLQFKVECYDNVSKSYLETILQLSAEEPKNNEYDCFVCCFLSHGYEKGIYCNDGQQIDFAEIRRYFKGDVNPLHGKPKLFFIQACQGQTTGTGAKLMTDSPSNPNTIEKPPQGGEQVKPVAPPLLSTDADFLFYVATTPGTVSWRDTQIGSWFIQELRNVFISNASSKPLMELCRKLNNKIAYKEALQRNGEIAKMMSDCGMNTLRKKLYFNPGCDFH